MVIARKRKTPAKRRKANTASESEPSDDKTLFLENDLHLTAGVDPGAANRGHLRRHRSLLYKPTGPGLVEHVKFFEGLQVNHLTITRGELLQVHDSNNLKHRENERQQRVHERDDMADQDHEEKGLRDGSQRARPEHRLRVGLSSVHDVDAHAAPHGPSRRHRGL